MIVHFIETEPSERRFFVETLGRDHQLFFDDGPGEVGADAEVVSGFIYSPIDAGFVQAHPALKLVATRSTTHDHIDLKACRDAGITVCTVPSYGDYTVAEHTFALLLALTRRLRTVMNFQSHFSYEAIRGVELRSKTLGILGVGRIGLNVVPIANAFGMRVIAHDPHPNSEAARALGFEYLPLDRLLAESDILTLHATLNASTYHILDERALAKCKTGVLIINTSRGALIDTEALLEALDSGQVGGIGLDVLEDETVMRKEALNVISEQIIERIHHEFPSAELRAGDSRRIKELQELVRNKALLAREDVVFTPHVAFNSVEAIERINQATVENIAAYVSGTPKNVLV